MMDGKLAVPKDDGMHQECMPTGVHVARIEARRRSLLAHLHTITSDGLRARCQKPLCTCTIQSTVHAWARTTLCSCICLLSTLVPVRTRGAGAELVLVRGLAGVGVSTRAGPCTACSEARRRTPSRSTLSLARPALPCRVCTAATLCVHPNIFNPFPTLVLSDRTRIYSTGP